VTVPTTPNRGYPYPTLTGANNPPVDFQQLAEAVDTDVTALFADKTARASYVGDVGDSAQTGAGFADFTYTTCEIALTPGTWLIEGRASVQGSTADGCCLSLWDQTNNVEIPNSTGTAVFINVPPSLALAATRPTRVVLASNRTIRIRVKRNGSAAVTVTNSAGAPYATLDAYRLA
jgi:hypothetical protein